MYGIGCRREHVVVCELIIMKMNCSGPFLLLFNQEGLAPLSTPYPFIFMIMPFNICSGGCLGWHGNNNHGGTTAAAAATERA